MGDPSVSAAARALSMQRWGAMRPRRLAAELTRRADELPAGERARLIEALEQQDERARLIAALEQQQDVRLIAALEQEHAETTR
jgi:hypothetical protein